MINNLLELLNSETIYLIANLAIGGLFTDANYIGGNGLPISMPMPASMYIDYIKVYEKLNDRWELAVSVSSNDKFNQVSFVNGIATTKGGVHVDTVVKLITSGVVAYIKKKNKRDVQGKYVKNYLSIYLNSVINNPSFDSQTKERLITPKSKF